MAEAEALAGGDAVAADQVHYSLGHRGVERELIPWCAGHEVAVMAYSPLEQGGLVRKPALERVAERHGVDAYQVALAWSIRLYPVMAVVKAGHPDHVRANAAAADLRLTEEDLAELDRDYPPAEGSPPLHVI